MTPSGRLPDRREDRPEPKPAYSDRTLKESYAWCNRLARTQAKNFYYSFLLLTPPQRQAMCAIYAFMRYCDDLSDDEGIADRVGAIARWRSDLKWALAGQLDATSGPQQILWPAFIDSVDRYSIPHHYFFEMIEGVSSDLEPRRIQTFEELYQYCYQVASVVGLTIVHIFGFEAPEALDLAEKCGIAFQLTNILRDIREDAAKDRIYLPQEDLIRFGVPAEELAGGGFRVRSSKVERSKNFRRLMEFEANRAADYYRFSAPLVGLVHPKSRASLRALIGIYSRLLDRIVRSDYDVLEQRARVPTWEKLWILVRSMGT